MKVKIFVLYIFVSFLLCGCVIDVYKDSKYGEMAIDAWFNDDTLGDARKRSENISEIVSKSCEFIESKKNKYVFQCKITYKEKGETVIPLSKNSTLNVYAVFIKEDGNKYNSKVYNSKYEKEDEVWKNDEYLNY